MLMNTNAGTFEINIGQFHDEFTVAEPGIELFMSLVVSTNTLDVIDDRYEFLSIWHILRSQFEFGLYRSDNEIDFHSCDLTS